MSQVQLNKVRISFIQNLWTAGEFKAGDGKFRRSASFVIEPGSDNETNVKAAIVSVAQATWGDKAIGMLKNWAGNSSYLCAIMDKTSLAGEVYEGFENMLCLTSNRREKDGPLLIVGRDGRTVLGEGSGVIYGGCFVNATVHFYTTQGQYPGVRCQGLGVQFHSDGDAFSGGTGPIEAFKDLTDGADAGEVTEEAASTGKAFDF